MKHLSEKLESIPSIGKSLAADLRLLGYAKTSDLRGADPQEMYNRLSALTHARQDPCVLYTFRCVVYAASGGKDPEKLLWWHWKL